jgi:hypothetical protein
MPSQAMQDVIDTLRGQQKAAASQPSPTLEQRRAAFAPAGRLHPLPDDVVVTDVTAGGTSSGPGSANQTAQVNDMRTIAGSKRPVNVRAVMAPVQESAP